MKDCAYLLNSTFGFLTLLVLARHGISKLGERVRSKALVPKGEPK